MTSTKTSPDVGQLLDLEADDVLALLKKGIINAATYHAYLLLCTESAEPDTLETLPFVEDAESFDDDLESRETALREIAAEYARVAVTLAHLRGVMSHLHARHILIEKGVKEARRRKERNLGMTLGNGTKIFTMEAASTTAP